MVISAASAATQPSRPNLILSVDSGDAMDVREFQIVDRVSGLFEIQIVALSHNPEIDFDAVIGKPASFRIGRDRLRGQAYRAWTGLCIRMHQIASEEEGLSTYELTLVPRLWLLTQRRNYRMFQQLSDLEIVQTLLAEWNIEPELRVDAAAYKKRKYRVQYGETDYTFISRLLEDCGITFYFDQIDDETKLVLNDAPQNNELRDPPVRYIDRPMVDKDIELVTQVRVGQQTRPGKYTIFDHDYRRPADYRLQGTAAAGKDDEQRFEHFHYIPGAFLFRTDAREPTPSADDKGAARHDEGEAQKIAEKRLQAKRSNARVVTFRTNVIDLRPGIVMKIADHPRSDLAHRLLITEATYSGTSYGSWTQNIEARSAEVPYRPPLATPKPKAVGVESATVVGPPGEEIHVDEFGRVRVHFHWDRESRMNQDSSTWIHVSQPWGGAGYGGTNLPRVGQEVIVDFLGGDPDRPIIVGRVYTNLQKTPYSLPANKTVSGLRSASSPATGGYNELMFEDASGRELVRFQAEKDFTGLVKNDYRMNIQHDRTSNVGNNDSESVFKDQTVKVGKDRKVRVKENQQHSIGKNIIVQSVDGETLQKSRRKITQVSDQAIVLAVGSRSFIAIEHNQITIQSPMVYINPGRGIQAPPQPPPITDAEQVTGFIGSP